MVDAVEGYDRDSRIANRILCRGWLYVKTATRLDRLLEAAGCGSRLSRNLAPLLHKRVTGFVLAGMEARARGVKEC